MLGLGGNSCFFILVVEERLVTARISVKICLFSKYYWMLFWSFSADEDMLFIRTASLTTLVFDCTFFGGALRLGKVGCFWTTDW